MAFIIGSQLQLLFGLMVFVAAALFVVWIVMYRPEQIKTWMLFLFLIGTVGLVVSAVLFSGAATSLVAG